MKDYICPRCHQAINDLHRHIGKDINGLTRCEKYIQKMIPKKR